MTDEVKAPTILENIDAEIESKPIKPALPIMTITEFCKMYSDKVYQGPEDAAYMRIFTEERYREKLAEAIVTNNDTIALGQPAIYGFLKRIIGPVESEQKEFPELSFEIVKGAYLVDG